jgi:hypothetical protein
MRPLVGGHREEVLAAIATLVVVLITARALNSARPGEIVLIGRPCRQRAARGN